MRASSIPSARRSLWPHPPWAIAGIRWVAVGVFVLASLALAGKLAAAPGSLPGHLVAAFCALAGLAALAFRHRWPILVLFGETGLLVVITSMNHTTSANFQVLFLAVASYAYVSWTDGPRALPIVAGCWLVVLGAQTLTGTNSVQVGFSEAFLLGTATAVGLYVRSHRTLLATLQERAEQAEREQHWAAAQAVAQERVRIARELHDVVAHHVSLLVIQAGAVRESLPADHPTREVLDSMIAGGRTSMAELRHLLDALRAAESVPEVAQANGTAPPPVDGTRSLVGGPTESTPLPAARNAWAPPLPRRIAGERASRQPQPGIEDIPGLIERARVVGLPVELVTLGQPGSVLPVTSLAVYRIVQEALTNVVKHAPGAHTTVEVTHYPDAVQLRVTNGAKAPTDVLGPPPEIREQLAGNGSRSVGLGVVGMQERAALCGGQLSAGPTIEGFEVTARLPARPSGHG